MRSSLEQYGAIFIGEFGQLDKEMNYLQVFILAIVFGIAATLGFFNSADLESHKRELEEAMGQIIIVVYNIKKMIESVNVGVP